MAVFLFRGRQFKRAYRVKFCEAPGCNNRIVFRLSAKGVPEGSDKNNKRKTCSKKCAKLLQQQSLVETISKPQVESGTSDPFDAFLRGIKK